MKSTILVGILATLTSSLHAQQVPEPRVFDEISIQGNSRFSDQDILATAGLSAGRTLSQQDLELAVEALDYTGEFDSISISSAGSTLTIIVDEQPEYSGDLSFGVGYDSDSGVLGTMDIRLTDVFSQGVDFEANARVAREFQTATTQIASEDLLGNGAVAGIRLSYASYDFDNTLFDFEQLSVGPFVSLPLSEQSRVELRYQFIQDEIRNVDPDASSILLSEAGKISTSLIGASFQSSGEDVKSGLSWSLSLSQDLAFGDEQKYSRTLGRVSGALPIAQTGFGLRSTVEAGRVSGTDGSTPRATDRFTLGGAALRGFERGGISPRDEGTTTTSLGGNSYAVARTDFLLPVFENQPGFDLFVFADIGSVWGVETDVAADGVLNDAQLWRTSRGIGASYVTQLGHFEAYYAITTESEDLDETRALGLTFRSDF